MIQFRFCWLWFLQLWVGLLGMVRRDSSCDQSLLCVLFEPVRKKVQATKQEVQNTLQGQAKAKENWKTTISRLARLAYF
jgi:hypothetical protein